MSETVDEPAHPLRRLRTRGSFTTRIASRSAESLTDGGAELVRALRSELGPLPLCVATYVRTKEDEGAIDWILPHLEDRDALWVIGSGELPERDAGPLCYLDLRKEKDERHMRHLIADALLLPQWAANTTAIVDTWHRRAGLIVLDATEDAGVDEVALLKSFPGVSLRLGNALTPYQMHSPSTTSAWYEVFARFVESMPILETRPTKVRDLRHTFAPLANRPGLLARTVECIQHSKWDRWTAYALPACYVPNARGKPGRAFIWSCLEQCFEPDTIKVKDRLCGGGVLYVEVSADADRLGKELNAYLQPVLTRPLNTEIGIYGAVSKALAQYADRNANARVSERAETLMTEAMTKAA